MSRAGACTATHSKSVPRFTTLKIGRVRTSIAFQSTQIHDDLLPSIIADEDLRFEVLQIRIDLDNVGRSRG
jgi:hypothetical protein